MKLLSTGSRLVLLIVFLFIACNRNEKISLSYFESINLHEIDTSDSLALSDLCSDLTYVNLKVKSGSFNNFQIYKICLTQHFIIILWGNSDQISFFDRKGNYRFSLSDLMKSKSFSIPIDIKYDYFSNLLYVLYEEGLIYIIKVDPDYQEVASINKIGTLEINEIVKLPGSNLFALSILRKDLDFALAKSLPIKKRALIEKKSIYSRYYGNVVLKNSFITDSKEYYYMKYRNDTIYKVTRDGLSPRIAFNFSGFNMPDTLVSTVVPVMESNSPSGLIFFNFINDAFLLKYLLNKEVHYLFHLNNDEFVNIKSENITNDIFGSTSLNCLGVDPITGSFAFQIPSNTLHRYRSKGKDFINERFYSQIDNLGITEDETTVLVLLKLK